MVWAALTGGNSYKEFDCLDWQYIKIESRFAIPNFNSTFLTTAKTKSDQAKNSELSLQAKFMSNMPERYSKSVSWDHQAPTIVADHTFAVLGYYNVLYKNTYVELIHLFNPWQVDIQNNEFDDTSSFWESKEVQRQNIPFTKDVDDGKFFLQIYDFLRNFEKIFQMKVDYINKPIIFQIPLSNLASKDVNLEFIDNCTGYEFYWDILVGNNYDVQIQPYTVTGYPNFDPIKNINNPKENHVYQGIKLQTNQVSLKVVRYNYDIVDTISFFIYASNKTTDQNTWQVVKIIAVLKELANKIFANALMESIFLSFLIIYFFLN